MNDNFAFRKNLTIKLVYLADIFTKANDLSDFKEKQQLFVVLIKWKDLNQN